MLALLVATSACAGPQMPTVVRQRMAADYSCYQDPITVTQLPGGAYRADGCGADATYVCSFDAANAVVCVKEAGGTPMPAPHPPRSLTTPSSQTSPPSSVLPPPAGN